MEVFKIELEGLCCNLRYKVIVDRGCVSGRTNGKHMFLKFLERRNDGYFPPIAIKLKYYGVSFSCCLGMHGLGGPLVKDNQYCSILTLQ